MNQGMTMLNVAKITRKGQVTIPKNIREKLKSDVVEFEVVENQVILKPVASVAGSLQKYARKKRGISFREAREKAWDEVIHERHIAQADRR
jgi:AbrB family looped-hinge helix DNA binding protein